MDLRQIHLVDSRHRGASQDHGNGPIANKYHRWEVQKEEHTRRTEKNQLSEHDTKRQK